jgi:hypothetical protein
MPNAEASRGLAQLLLLTPAFECMYTYILYMSTCRLPEEETVLFFFHTYNI